MPDASYTLVAVETASIQSYIFASNRLKENVGASYLVAAATGKWAEEAVKDVTGVTDLEGLIQEQAVEKLYSGGGNIVLLFKHPDHAKAFIRKLSRRVLFEAPGLKLTFSSQSYEWKDSLSEAVSDLLTDMKQQRSYQPALRGDAGQGVTIMGVSTSMPAVTLESDPDSNWIPISAETVAKRNASNEANKLLRKTLDLGDRDYRFAVELDDLGRSKDNTSYIAVVHADGNGLGKFIKGLREKYTRNDDSTDSQETLNRDYITYMRWFSDSVKDIAARSQQDMARQILDSVEGRTLYGIRKLEDNITLKKTEDGQTVFPIRPLVSGGDDVTFVCDGRIGIDLALTFLRSFEKHAEAILNGVDAPPHESDVPLTACAGVAIVKTHYPFARAYTLADDLAGSAKQARYTYDVKSSALDWHITAGGLYGELEELREREYEVQDGNLTLRPIFIDSQEDEMLNRRSWGTVSEILRDFQTKWRNHRNKAEALRDVLRKGELETKIYKVKSLTSSKANHSQGDSPYLPEVGGFEDSGWVYVIEKDDEGKDVKVGYCGYYDALELMDKYIPLKQTEATDS